MYTREPIVKAIEVKALTDVKPAFVSLVDHAATQTPLKVIKADAEPIEPVEISGINFTGAVFSSEEIVVKWLQDGGYKDYKITKTDSGFSAEWDIPQGYNADSTTTISGVDGVEIVLVKATKQEQEQSKDMPTNIEELAVKGEEEKKCKTKKEEGMDGEEMPKEKKKEKVSKAELTKKYDYWAAYCSEGVTTVADALRAGADSLPIGINELNDAFYNALEGATEAGDLGMVVKIAQEFADYYTKLVEAVPEAIKTEVETTMKSDTPVTEVIADPAGLTQSNVDVNAIVTAITTGFSTILAAFGNQQAVMKEDMITKADAEKSSEESAQVIKALQDRIDALENRGQASNNLGIAEQQAEATKKSLDAFEQRRLQDTWGIR